MIKSLKIGDKESYADFGQMIASRTISIPEKRIIKESVPFKNGSYDFTNINGEATFEDRTITYVFDIIGATMEEVEQQKQEMVSWLSFVEDEDIFDGYIDGYHFHGSFESFDWSENWEQSQLSVTFSVYPYMIADEPTIKTVSDLSKKTAKSVTVNNNGSHSVIPAIRSDSPINITHGSTSYSMGQSELFSLTKYKSRITTAGKQFVEVTKDGRSTITQVDNTDANIWGKVDIIEGFDPNSQYTVSLDACTKGNFCVVILYTDGSKDFNSMESLTEYEWRTITVTTDPTKTIERIYTSVHNASRDDLQFWIDTASFTCFKSNNAGKFDFSVLKQAIADKGKQWVGTVKDGRRVLTQVDNAEKNVWFRVEASEDFDPNTQYTFTADVFNGYNFSPVFLYTDGTADYPAYDSNAPKEEWVTITLTSDPKKVISRFYLSYQNTSFDPRQYWIDVDKVSLIETEPTERGEKNQAIRLQKGSNSLSIKGTGTVDIIFREEVL